MTKAATSLARTSSDYSIHSVEKALDLLEAICDHGGEARITELSQRLGMNKTNVFRLLATFENRGFVERGEDSAKYRLGLSAYEMGRKLLSHMDILRKARPAMERLVRQCGEAVYFLTPRQHEVLVLDMVDSPQLVKVVPLTGRRLPLGSPLGEIFTAFAPHEVRERRLREGADRGTQVLAERLAAIRQQGYVVDRESLDDGVTGIGVPLFNFKDQPVGILAIVGPTFRLGEERIAGELIPILIESGQIVSTNLGYVRHFLAGKAV